MDKELDGWFTREILPHEAALVRYLTRRWPNRDDVYDLRQEAYVRVYEAAGKSRPTSPKSFLFTTARNLMADRVRRERVVSIEAWADLDALNVLVDELTPERHESALQQLRRLAEAFKDLPPKCREVVWMRRVDGVSQKEVASRLKVTEGTVEKHVARGVRILADFLYGATSKVGAKAERGEAEVESEYGQSPRD